MRSAFQHGQSTVDTSSWPRLLWRIRVTTLLANSGYYLCTYGNLAQIGLSGVAHVSTGVYGDDSINGGA